jgi:hypothetical protein
MLGSAVDRLTLSCFEIAMYCNSKVLTLYRMGEEAGERGRGGTVGGGAVARRLYHKLNSTFRKCSTWHPLGSN